VGCPPLSECVCYRPGPVPDSVDRFTTDIAYMRVLERPTLIPASPTKRKISRKDPLTPDLSPSKKLRHT
jgi:hypothetical protein